MLVGILPLITAIAGVVITNLALLALTGVVNESSTTSILATMIGLAVGIDYSLFVLNRHRQQLVDGLEIGESIGRAVATSGSSVCFAGTTVLIALAALSVVNIPFLTVMGLAAAGAVVVAVLAAITLMPALLGFAGSKLLSSRVGPAQGGQGDRTRLPVTVPPIRDGAEAGSGRGGAGRDRRSAGGGVPIPAYAARTARRGVSAHQPDHPPGLRPGLAGVRSGFQRPAARGRLQPWRHHAHPEAGVHVLLRSATDAPGTRRGLHRGTHSPTRPGHLLVTVIPKTGPNDPATTHLINNIRSAVAQGKTQYGLTTYVTGQTALNIDTSAKLSSALPTYLAIIILLCLILLIVVFRSILVPVTAVIGYVLSVLAALGAVTFVFQKGHLNGVFGIARSGPVLSFLPIILLGVLFGLAMDYEVFLASRMREESFVEDPDAAVIDGYAGSAKVVGCAAIIMISVFASFIFSPDPTTKSLGFALALGVLIDAFVVRMTIVPATMHIYGKSAWWLPRWLGKLLPDMDIEGRRFTEPTPAAPAPGDEVPVT